MNEHHACALASQGDGPGHVDAPPMASSYRPSIEMGRNLQGRVQLSTLSKGVGGGDSGGGGGSRLLSFVSCMFIVSLTSGNYAFSFFSGALKCTLDITQAQLDSIGVYPTLAGLFTWTTGACALNLSPQTGGAVGKGGERGSRQGAEVS
eukprot:COSAG01_NODE_14413_length_1456_cov_40.344141_3_plen_149_part_00